ncbi:hypothetical protein MVES1_000658 [Malassezia vespertilionis]|uniref:Micro-fibrillar-associated protein 1 C-terminal domain-containing protein n=1 Tax=Malassezia vespertilionis TaxID=2020962 RepID=A0A2N1JH70_9BASI|nr:uncharacterized protein MVES1_000658 [Malassezia vespertilionis]PKI85894.1 hypothetical protein MVES_000610 [Malassezia vespertilionis]WFD05328.1 hypothetical protein MVES1_000658 [Malassezia vespertilionis]
MAPQRIVRPARYRAGKAPTSALSDSSDEDVPVQEPVKELLTLPSHTVVPTLSAGVTIQQGDGAIALPSGVKQDSALSDVNLSEYETDSGEDGEGETTPAPSTLKWAPMQDAQKPAQVPTAETLRHSTVSPPLSSEYASSSEYESDSSEERPMLKPVFVSKRDRTSGMAPKGESSSRTQVDTEERKQAAHQLAAESIMREMREQQHEEETVDVDDTDGVDPDAEFAGWRMRELTRIQRVRDEERAALEEQAELARRRTMPEAERLQEDLARARKTREEKHKGNMGFMQKYYHKGAFFQDMDVLQRDYSQHTQDAVDKAALPKIMQVRDYGKRSRSKWTHLAAEDTTRQDAPDLRAEGARRGKHA